MGRNDFEIYPQHLAEAFFADETRLFANQVPLVKIEWTRRRGGEPMLTVTIKQLVRSRSGEVLGLMGIARHLASWDPRSRGESKERILELLEHDVAPDVTPAQLHALKTSLDDVLAESPHRNHPPRPGGDG